MFTPSITDKQQKNRNDAEQKIQKKIRTYNYVIKSCDVITLTTSAFLISADLPQIRNQRLAL